RGQAHHRPQAQPLQDEGRSRWRQPQDHRLGLRAHRHRRRDTLGLRGSARRRKATTAIAFLRRAVAFFKRHGMTVQELLTDNGSAYRAAVHAIACRTLGIRHLRTRPRRPQTNGKAERLIRTMLAGWAYGALYGTNRER